MINPTGVGIPICRLFFKTGNSKGGQEVYKLIADWDNNDGKAACTEFITSFSYKLTEDKGDECTIVVSTSNSQILDKKWTMAGAEIKVIWGYQGGVSSKPKLLKVKTVKPNFTSNGVDLTIVAVDRTSDLRETRSKEVHESPSGNPEQPFSFVEVITKFCKKHGIVLKAFGHIIYDGRERISGTSQANSSSPVQENRTLMEIIRQMGRPKDGDIDTVQKSADVQYKAYPQANKSDWLLLKEMLTQQSGGPYKLTCTDNTIELNKRDLSKKPLCSFTWEGGSGNLLSIDGKIDDELSSVAAGNIQADFVDTFSKTVNTKNFNSLSVDEYGLGSFIKAFVGSWVSFNSITDRTTSYIITKSLLAAAGRAVVSKTATWTIGEGLLAGLFGITLGWEIGIGMVIVQLLIPDQYQPSALFGRWFPTLPDDGQPIYDPKYPQIPAANDAYSGVNNAAKVPYTFYDKLGAPQQYEIRRDLSQILKSNITGGDYPSQNTLHTAEDNPLSFENVASNYQAEKAMEGIEMDLDIIMDPRIIPGDLVQLNGIGSRYGGNYYVAEAIHSISGSSFASSKLKAKKNAFNAASSDTDGTIQTDVRTTYASRPLDEEDVHNPHYNNIFPAKKVNTRQSDEELWPDKHYGRSGAERTGPVPDIDAENPLPFLHPNYKP